MNTRFARRNSQETTGFAGLASLTSDTAEKALSPRAGSKKESVSETRLAEEQATGQSTTPEPERAVVRTPGSSSRSDAAARRLRRMIWPIGIVGVIVGLNWISEQYRGGTPERSYMNAQEFERRAPSAKSAPSGETHTPEAMPEPQLADLEFREAPVGRNNVLSVAEIRWCLAVRISIETLEPMAATNEEISNFNEVVEQYNNQCGSYRYRQRAFARAQRDIEQHREEIVSRVVPPWR